MDSCESSMVVSHIMSQCPIVFQDDIDDAAHLLCSDGAISTIKKGGRAVCTAATPQENRGFVVFA